MTTWQPIANQDVTDKVFGKQLYNKIRNNLIRLKELYDLDHAFEIGTHDPATMRFHWAKAFGVYYDDSILGVSGVEINSHNIRDVDHIGEGTYRFNFINKISKNAIASSSYIGVTGWRRTAIKDVSSTKVTVLIYNQYDALVDLHNESVSIAVMRYI